MSRRFSDEPINLIRRIPTPEQLSAARPSKRSLGQVLLESGAACARGLAEAVASFTRWGRKAQATPADRTPSLEICSEESGHAPGRAPVDDRSPTGATCAGDRLPEEAQLRIDPAPAPISAQPATAVQPEEMAELRAFLLAQQQDIARLSAQIHELKSLVLSQQQALLYLGKEMESGPLSAMTTGVASAPLKRNRPGREKQSVKDKALGRKDAPATPSLSL
ncbi:hypothetical protein [Nitrospira moscoviensis]|nr:hypothetical protein [Nitrospira moscoviensis]